MAAVSQNVTVEVFQVDEFPGLASKYNVTTLPKTVINDRLEFVGAAPEAFIVEKLLSFNTSGG